MGVMLAAFAGLRFVLSLLQPEPGLTFVVREILKWSALAAITLFVLSTAIHVILSLSQSVVELRATRGKWRLTVDVISYAAGFVTIFVVYTLFNRATLTENVVAKSLIYLAGIGLLFEVSLMAYVRAKRSLSSGLANSHVDSVLVE